MGTNKTAKKVRRINICLVNPTEEERLLQEPLIAFSYYLSDRNNVLLSISDEIIENLDKGFTNKSYRSNRACFNFDVVLDIRSI